MQYKILFILLLATISAAAQCPGPSQRTALLNLQRSLEIESTRAGQIPLTDTCGNQRYAQYVEVELDTIGYTPMATGNVSNLSEFVIDPTGAIFYIDWQGNAIEFAGGSSICDVDWLQISDNSCPDAITDSIYKQRYASVGARYVWPGAEFLVNDSLTAGILVIQGSRNARTAWYDSNAGTFSMFDHGGSSPVFYMPAGANLTFKTTAGTPQTPIGSQVNHFAINAQDSTIQMNQYPRTRVDTQAVMNFLYTDPVGKVRSRDVAYLTDTLGFGANIYNSDGNILAGVIRQVALDSTAELAFSYPSGPDAIRVYGGDDSTSGSGYVQIRGPGDNHGRFFTSSSYVSMIKQNSDAQSYIEFGPDDAGISVVIEDVTPEQGRILLSNQDGFFHFAALDTFSGIPNIYNSNGVIQNETERVVIVDTLSSLSFSTPLDGGDLQLLEVVAGDGTGANSSVSMRAGTDGNENRILVEDQVGVNGYWQDGTEVRLSDVSENNFIWQNGTEFHVEGSVDTGTYFIISDNTVPTLYAGVGSGTAETSLDMDAATGEESFMLRTSGDNGDVQAFVSGTLATVSTTPQLVVAAYDANAPQFSLNEIRIDTAGVGINTRGGVGNAGEALISNGEKLYYGYPNGLYPNVACVGDTEISVDCERFLVEMHNYNSDNVSSIQADTNGIVYIGTQVSGDQIGTVGFNTTLGNGLYVSLPATPEPGQILVSDTDGTFYFADRDTGFIDPGVLSADALSWTGGGTWTAVNANRALFVQASGTITPSIGVTEIIVNDTATTSTVNLNYVPGELDGASYAQPYTTVRYIYNWGSSDCTVDTNQDWLFRTQGNGAGQTTLTIPTGQAYKLVWIQGSSEANSRFWCFRIN